MALNHTLCTIGLCCCLLPAWRDDAI